MHLEMICQDWEMIVMMMYILVVGLWWECEMQFIRWGWQFEPLPFSSREFQGSLAATTASTLNCLKGGLLKRPAKGYTKICMGVENIYMQRVSQKGTCLEAYFDLTRVTSSNFG